MKKLQFFSIFLVVALLAGLLSTTAIAAPEESDTFENLTISAKAALLVDGSTGQVLLQQDAHEQLYPASLTKCMTTLLVLQAVDEGTLSLDQTITASQTAINMLTDDSSSAGIQAGEQLTVEQLLYCVMVQSANEACYILAEAVSGSVDAFVEEMNAEAERLGCKDTHFVNPCGLHDPEHYTSAWDMYLIVKEAMNYSMFMTLANTKTYTLPATNLSEERTFHTTNGLIDRWRYTEYIYPYAQGIKTGHTSDAGYCLVSYAEQGSRSLIGVVLGAQAVTENGSTTIQSFSEMRRMFEWGFSSFTSTTILDHASLIEEIPVTLSRQTNYVSLHPSEDVTVLLPSNVAAEDLVTGSNAGQRICGSPRDSRSKARHHHRERQQRKRIHHHRSGGRQRCIRLSGADTAAPDSGAFRQSAGENSGSRYRRGSDFPDCVLPASAAPALSRRPELPHPPQEPPLPWPAALVNRLEFSNTAGPDTSLVSGPLS